MAASLTFRTKFTQCLFKKIIRQCISVSKDSRSISSASLNVLCSPQNEAASGSANDSNTRDPYPIFLDSRVQEILTKITGFNILKVAGPHKTQLRKPKYKLLTDAELKGEMTQAKGRLKKRLQIPPYMNPRKPTLTPLAVDPDLAHFDTSSYVFTDVTFGVKDRDRSVVLRETDGTLRVAPWDVKDRMNQIYNPREGKEYLRPIMFEEVHMKRMISEKKYVYILDRACCQFEPDDPDFIRTTHRVFKAVNDAKDHDDLRSTRHFGSLTFYLIWYKMVDNLLLDMLNRDLASDAQDLVQLYCILHPDSTCATALSQLSPNADIAAHIKAYIETSSSLSSELELALQAMEDSRSGGREKNPHAV